MSGRSEDAANRERWRIDAEHTPHPTGDERRPETPFEVSLDEVLELDDAVLSTRQIQELAARLLERRERLEAQERDLQQRITEWEAGRSNHAHVGDSERDRRSAEDRRLAADRLFRRTSEIHRETLEARIAIEHLWGRLVRETGGRTDWLTRLLGRLRAQVRESMAEEERELQHRRAELTGLARRLREQQLRLRSQHERFVAWAQERSDALDRREQRLERWEAALRRQREELSRFRRMWRESRAGQSEPLSPYAAG